MYEDKRDPLLPRPHFLPGTPVTNGGKLFAGLYALYAGLVFLVAFAVVLAPIVHRVLHRFHLDEDEP